MSQVGKLGLGDISPGSFLLPASDCSLLPRPLLRGGSTCPALGLPVYSSSLWLSRRWWVVPPARLVVTLVTRG